MNVYIQKNYNDYYNIIYSNIFNNIQKENESILIINQKKFNILNFFSHVIKKKSIRISFYNSDKKFKDEIKGEECFDNITCLDDLNESDHESSYDKIIIFHLNSLDFLKDIIDKLSKLRKNNNEDDDKKIFIYTSLSNEKRSIQEYKNNIRSSLHIEYLLNFTDVVEILENTKELNIEKISIFKKNNYIIYGDNTVYEIILTPLD